MYITFFQVKFKCFALNLTLLMFFFKSYERNACLVAYVDNENVIVGIFQITEHLQMWEKHIQTEYK